MSTFYQTKFCLLTRKNSPVNILLLFCLPSQMPGLIYNCSCHSLTKIAVRGCLNNKNLYFWYGMASHIGMFLIMTQVGSDMFLHPLSWWANFKMTSILDIRIFNICLFWQIYQNVSSFFAGQPVHCQAVCGALSSLSKWRQTPPPLAGSRWAIWAG